MLLNSPLKITEYLNKKFLFWIIKVKLIYRLEGFILVKDLLLIKLLSLLNFP